jgi:hypothetical protein
MKQLSDNLMTAVSQAAIEMKRIVTENKTELDIIRCKTHLPKQCAMAFSRIREMNDFIYHSKVVGAVLSFRQLLADASQSVRALSLPPHPHGASAPPIARRTPMHATAGANTIGSTQPTPPTLPNPRSSRSASRTSFRISRIGTRM